jgi:hypothetical protein
VKWSDISTNPGEKTLRQFATAWLVFLLAAGLHQFFAHGHHRIGLTLGLAAVSIGALGLVKPAAILGLFVFCLRVTFPIGWVVSQLMLLLMFYFLITPVALIFRLKGRDPLARKPAPGRTTFWVRASPPQDVRSYFRQY